MTFYGEEKMNECLQESNITLSTSRFIMKLVVVQQFDPISLKIPERCSHVEKHCQTGIIDQFLENRCQNAKLFFLISPDGKRQRLLIPHADDEEEVSIDISKRSKRQVAHWLLFTVAITEKNTGEEDTSGYSKKCGWVWEQEKPRKDRKRRLVYKDGKFRFDPPFVFDRMEQLPDRFEMPDWVDEEDRKAREKKQTRSNKPKKAKKEKKQNSKLSNKTTSKTKQGDVQNDPSRNRGESDMVSGELELDDGHEADWNTVGNQDKSNGETNTSEIVSLVEDLKEISLSEKESEESELGESSSSPSSSPVDDPKKEENCSLKEQLDRFLTCQICFEYYDDGKRARYSHSCGHGCCWTCMKMEFARQREARRRKFYCHCGFEIHEKKIIRMFL
ncbi:Oidioi.mRNA.OKI2018_I69.chr2.g6023.t1.cds [Oikopleura dioica]|uniref:Oidioi.mRNA.OKI2018_I69.chr2.g6023.t1.cds n=1 Tax=Oikopleura dioica TaxID=34765 RepID=A0ABN7T5D0_OIKDI|nr:Oidioi.mRNA.OKI2018_I69.chr2.g6023.t1.cds [Oikopleura dioica]